MMKQKNYAVEMKSEIYFYFFENEGDIKFIDKLNS